jgi:putative ABC transport system permease protein
VSYLLVTAAPGQQLDALAARLRTALPGVTVQRRAEFAAQERRLVRDMSTDLITIMNTAGFVIGLAVLALTVYTATHSRRREYGVLKALGARSSHLYRAVVAQALASVGLGFAAGVGVTLLLGALTPRLGSALALDLTMESLAKVAGASLAIAALSAALPIRQVANLDPAAVFRGR